ncbi:MAG TPA: helix-turn-helix transcriptional regulator [Rhodanobacteraceae bacterium]|nr:helix-turn-helix transcriptional regulator [Rhodanobacteraceae bacterium]
MTARRDPASFTRLCAARERLCERDERVPLARVAREARLSTGELIRRFAALFGETPHQYRLRERLDRAKRLLARSERSVTDVCMEVGFSSVGSFSAWFARCAGRAPSEYRRHAKARAAEPASSAASLEPGCLSLLTAALAHPAYRAATAISEKR